MGTTSCKVVTGTRSADERISNEIISFVELNKLDRRPIYASSSRHISVLKSSQKLVLFPGERKTSSQPVSGVQFGCCQSGHAFQYAKTDPELDKKFQLCQTFRGEAQKSHSSSKNEHLGAWRLNTLIMYTAFRGNYLHELAPTPGRKQR